MPIHDVGYRGWSGRRLSSVFSWMIMVWSGIVIARRSQWVRRVLVMAWLPTVYLGSGFYLYEDLMKNSGADDLNEFRRFFVQSFETPGRSELGELETILDLPLDEQRHQMWSWLLACFLAYPQSILSLLLVGLLAPPLIARDFRSKAFLIYFSKPIGKLEYLAGKVSIVSSFLFFVTLAPALGLYLFAVMLSPNLYVIVDTWDLPFRVALASMVFVVPTALLALMFSSLTTETRYAAFSWFAFWGLGYSAWMVIRLVLIQYYMQVENLRQPPWGLVNSSSWSLLSLYDSLVRIQSWILGFDPSMTFPWAQGAVVALITLFAIVILLRRVSAPIRV